MKKVLFGLILSLCALTAQAQTTVTLDPTGAYQANGCIYAPANDAGLSISWFCGTNRYGRVSTTIDGVFYDSGLYALPAYSLSFSDVALYGANGVTIHATASYYTTRNCVRTGRGQSCTTHYLLAAGDLVLP